VKAFYDPIIIEFFYKKSNPLFCSATVIESLLLEKNFVVSVHAGIPSIRSGWAFKDFLNTLLPTQKSPPGIAPARGV
jgi:hypothetical protein